MNKLLSYLSHHAIALVALTCSLLALAGASYAAIALPKNSVGNRQIQRGAVAPPKFSKQIGGYVRAYAMVNANGRLSYSSPRAKLRLLGRFEAIGPELQKDLVERVHARPEMRRLAASQRQHDRPRRWPRRRATFHGVSGTS